MTGVVRRRHVETNKQNNDEGVFVKNASVVTTVLDVMAAIRVRQWIKNLVIPVVGLAMMGPQPDVARITVDLLMAFAAFCVAASSIYVLNDMLDISKDQAHPVKCGRPIASGRISLPCATVGLMLSIPCALTLAWWVSPRVSLLLATYLAINVGYCFKFKHVPHLDVVCVASGFTIRALTGAFAVGRLVDFWLLAAITFACMGLAIMKRMKELKNVEASSETRPVLAGYDYETLLRAHDMFMVLAVLSLTLFLEHSTKTQHDPIAVAASLTCISAMFLVFIHRVQGDTDGDPTTLIYRNKLLSLSVLGLTFALYLLI